MIHKNSLAITILILIVLQSVCANLDGNPEGNDGSGIRTVDTQGGFNVTDSGGNYSILTSYLFNQCDAKQKATLKQAVIDANILAFAGIKRIARPGAPPLDWIDFTSEAAVDYFGPSSKSGDQQGKIYTTLTRASYAYRGWGWDDWWSNRYVQLNCNTTIAKTSCDKGKVLAATQNNIKDFGYPVITFCKAYFTNLPSFDTVIKYVDAKGNESLRENSLNMRNQGTTMLHEWIHINWGAAEVCPGGAKDNIMHFGPKQEPTKAYRPGRTKLLARRNVEAAANNNDNYVFFSLSWFMVHRYHTYPQYPAAWDPNKSVADNVAHQVTEPGYPPLISAPDNVEVMDDDDDDPIDSPVIDGPLYDPSEYPDWYKPIVTASVPSTSPATLPPITTPSAPTAPPPDAPTMTIDGPSPSVTSAPPPTQTAILECSSPSLEDGDGLCTCSFNSQNVGTYTPISGICPTSLPSSISTPPPPPSSTSQPPPPPPTTSLECSNPSPEDGDGLCTCSSIGASSSTTIVGTYTPNGGGTCPTTIPAH